MDLEQMVKDAKAAVRKTINASAKKHVKAMAAEYKSARERLKVDEPLYEEFKVIRERMGIPVADPVANPYGSQSRITKIKLDQGVITHVELDGIRLVSKEEAVTIIKSGGRIFTVSPDTGEQLVVVANRLSGEYIRASRDKESNDNLLSLPRL